MTASLFRWELPANEGNSSLESDCITEWLFSSSGAHSQCVRPFEYYSRGKERILQPAIRLCTSVQILVLWLLRKPLDTLFKIFMSVQQNTWKLKSFIFQWGDGCLWESANMCKDPKAWVLFHEQLQFNLTKQVIVVYLPYRSAFIKLIHCPRQSL